MNREEYHRVSMLNRGDDIAVSDAWGGGNTQYLERCKQLRIELCVSTAQLSSATKEIEESMSMRAKMRMAHDKLNLLQSMKVKSNKN
jgi:hypothetical protein